MKNFFVLPMIILIGGFALGACKVPPIEEMNKAADAVARAENDDNAVIYAGNTLLRAREVLDKMKAEADSKRYDAAKNSAAEAIGLAEKAIADGKNAAARAKDEAARLLALVGTEIADTEGELNSAVNAGNLILDVDRLEQNFDTAKTGYEDARECMNGENYQDAISKAQPVRPILADIRSQINQAAVEVSRKK
ncbi:MAG: hypothetical protein LBH43_02235 [Treponema sp.]|nr:hypothetical protein [Treponema sp.]